MALPSDAVTCPHCLVLVQRPSGSLRTLLAKPTYELMVEAFSCPSCSEPVVSMLKGKGSYTMPGSPVPVALSPDTERWLAYPRAFSRPVPPEVPEQLASDYHEAASVLYLSPKASAALSRRCLQNTIREVSHIKKANLGQEIEELVNNGVVSSGLGSELDAIRNIGNFAAHPVKSTETGAIIDVEPGEAEWTLDLLDRLFDELIVQPAKTTTRKQALNAKLKAMGKPEIP